MLHLHPFSAYHVAPNQAKEFVSLPIDLYNSSQIDNTIDTYPHSFLSIIQPNLKEDFKNIRKRFLTSPYLKQDLTPSFYVYEIVENATVCKGIIAGVSCNKDSKEFVLPHENTLKKREKLFEKYLKTVRFNAEPVLLAFEDSKSIEHLIDAYSKKTPFYDFTFYDQRHRLWKISDTYQVTSLVAAFNKESKLYIADGHHRWASSSRVSKSSSNQEAQYCMCFLLPTSSLQLDSFYRIIDISDLLNGKEFLKRLSDSFAVYSTTSYQTPRNKNSFSFYVNGSWYAADYPKNTSLNSVELLHEKIIKPILGIEDFRKNPCIEYGYSQRPNKEIEKKTKQESDFLGITHFPINFDEIRSNADQGIMLPPKSSFIQPKLPSGLLLHAW